MRPARASALSDGAELSQRIAAAASRGIWRSIADSWLLLQGTAAATAAWFIARRIADHSEPFFAPISAFIALNAARGERGLNALRFLLGVIVGIVAGDLTVAVLNEGYGRLALAVFLATSVARALSGARIIMAQAATASILTVIVAGGQAGPHRLEDALIGAGVALVFSQFLFSPEPVLLVRRAESAALSGMAEGLELTAQALQRDDNQLGQRALSTFRDLQDRLLELDRIRNAGPRLVRHSLVWRSRMETIVRENENAGHLELLGISCLMLTRAAIVTNPSERDTFTPRLRELAGVLANMAKNPADRSARQAAVDHALEIDRRLAATAAPSVTALGAATMVARMVIADVMLFAGVDPDRAWKPPEGAEISPAP